MKSDFRKVKTEMTTSTLPSQKISLFLSHSSLFLPPRLVAELESQFAESAKLEAAIRANLKSLNFIS